MAFGGKNPQLRALSPSASLEARRVHGPAQVRVEFPNLLISEVTMCRICIAISLDFFPILSPLILLRIQRGKQTFAKAFVVLSLDDLFPVDRLVIFVVGPKQLAPI